MNSSPLSGDVEVLRQLLHRALVRYLTVRPDGFILQSGSRRRRLIEARILGHGGARTLYKNRKPTCRSLDGLQPILGDTSRRCLGCRDYAKCTPQLRIDLIFERRSYRLLLAYSSARNFLAYDAERRQRGRAVEHVITKISVVNRGTWGELRFSAQD